MGGHPKGFHPGDLQVWDEFYQGIILRGMFPLGVDHMGFIYPTGC